MVVVAAAETGIEEGAVRGGEPRVEPPRASLHPSVPWGMGDSAGSTMTPAKSNSLFTKFAKWTSRVTGQPGAFALATGALVIWAVSGPFFGFSDTWQLVINTGTTIVTFLMVFLIQNTQNRDSEALHVKLDELIRSVRGANNSLLDLEELEVEELDRLRDEYEKLAERARNSVRRRKTKG